jgi:hypothetical protein
MSQKTNKLIWNVIYYNSNASKITTYNVFDHSYFTEDVKKHLKSCETKEDFAKKLHGSLMYYFWSKCEWEILIMPWGGGSRTVEQKVDVAWQVENNWELFVDYIWSQKPQRKKTTGRNAGENDG